MPAFNRRRCLGLLARATVLPFAAAPFAARADAGLIRIIVAYPPGGVADATARLLADQLAQRLGVSAVVENKAGAGGAIGLGAIAKAVPDGRTFGFASVSPVALLPHLGGKMPFDPQKDLAPAASVLASPVLLLATPANHAPDFRALLERARSRVPPWRAPAPWPQALPPAWQRCPIRPRFQNWACLKPTAFPYSVCSPRPARPPP